MTVYSTDGINWKSMGNGRINNIRYANKKYFIFPDLKDSNTAPDIIMYSTDGINWNYKTLDSITTLYDIIYFKNKYYLLGITPRKLAE